MTLTIMAMTALDSDILPTKCALCPRMCGANRAKGQIGICGASDMLMVARAALHEWEEPPISVGAGSGTVFFSCCPLQCIYCQNASIAHNGEGEAISIERLAQIFIRLQSQGAANINLVTPTHYQPQIREAITIAKQDGLHIPIVYNTSGYERAECIRAYASSIDIYLTDFKYWKSSESNAAEAYSRARNYYEEALLALDAMVELAGQPEFDTFQGNMRLTRGVVVRHLLLPGRLDDSKHIMSMLWQRYGTNVLYSIMGQYTPMRSFPEAPELGQPAAVGDYEALLDYCDYLGIPDYYWQEGGAVSSSFIPAFDGTGV